MPSAKRIKKVHHPELAAYFTKFRTEKGWSQNEAADIAARRHIPLSYQALRGLEDGSTKNPDPAQLRAFAKLYGVPYAEVVREVVGALYHAELVVPDGSALAQLEDTPHEQTDTRLVESRTVIIQELLATVSEVTKSLVRASETANLALAANESGTLDPGPARRRRGRGNTGG